MGTRYVSACSTAMTVVAAASVRPTVYVRAPTAEAIAIWSTSQGRGPEVGSSPTTRMSGTCACTASARAVRVLVNPAPYVVVAAASRPEARWKASAATTAPASWRTAVKRARVWQ